MATQALTEIHALKRKAEERENRLFKQGVLMQVNVRCWSMKVRLKEEDIPVREGEALPDLFVLGDKYLIPHEERRKIKKIEESARQALAKASFKYPIANAHFVPLQSAPKIQQKLEQYRVEYNQAVQQFLDNYHDIREQVLEKYPDQAHLLEPCYPRREELRKKFNFRVAAFRTSAPSEFHEWTDEELTGVAAKIENLDAKTTEELSAERAQKVEMLRQEYQDRLATVDEFVAGSVKLLRAKAQEVCSSISTKIQEGKLVTETNLKTVRTLISDFKELNFFDDGEVDKQLANLQKVVESGHDFKDNEVAVESLKTALDSVAETANNVSDMDEVSGRYFRDLAV